VTYYLLPFHALKFHELKSQMPEGGDEKINQIPPTYAYSVASPPPPWLSNIDRCISLIAFIGDSTCRNHILLHLKEYWFSTETKYCNILA